VFLFLNLILYTKSAPRHMPHTLVARDRIAQANQRSGGGAGIEAGSLSIR